jgi:dTDP-glucose 4,6-dehydratase
VDTGASKETDRLDPSSPYSASKAGGELMIISYHKTHRLPALVVRGANAYGPYQYPEKLIPLHVTNGIDSLPLPIYGDGQQRRQWTHVEDFVDGVDTVLRKGRVGEIYNIGNPETDEELAPNLTVTRRILELLGKPESLISYVTDRPAHDRRYRVDMNKLLGIGWQPRWTFAAGLEQTVRWYQDNDWWWRPIKSGDYRRYYEDNYENRERFAVAGDGSEGSR